MPLFQGLLPGLTVNPQTWSNRKKSDSKATDKDSQFRIMPDKNSMLLPDQGHKTGWVRKQFDRDAAATDGEGWKSKA